MLNFIKIVDLFVRLEYFVCIFELPQMVRHYDYGTYILQE